MQANEYMEVLKGRFECPRDDVSFCEFMPVPNGSQPLGDFLWTVRGVKFLDKYAARRRAIEIVGHG